MIIARYAAVFLIPLALLTPPDPPQRGLDQAKFNSVRMVLDESRYEPSTEPDVTTEPTEPTTTQTSYQDDHHYSNYSGRLYIPDAGIDVALYYGIEQEICDREDSANLFTMHVYDGYYIADHSNQEFSKLFNVRPGMRGYIQLTDGGRIDLVCTNVIDGHNTGKVIEDENGVTNLDADYVMYTCKDNWHNIILCLWDCC